MSAGLGGQGDLVSQTGPHHPHTPGRIDWPWAAANRKSQGSATSCHSGQMPRGNGKVGRDMWGQLPPAKLDPDHGATITHCRTPLPVPVC